MYLVFTDWCWWLFKGINAVTKAIAVFNDWKEKKIGICSCMKVWVHKLFIMIPPLLQIKDKCRFHNNLYMYLNPPPALRQAPRPWTTPTGCLTASLPHRLSSVAFGSFTCWRICGQPWSWWIMMRGTTCGVRFLIPLQRVWWSGCTDEW